VKKLVDGEFHVHGSVIIVKKPVEGKCCVQGSVIFMGVLS
jgi:hypothetical protein